jgi:transposase
VTPQRRGLVPDALADRLRAAVAAQSEAVEELHAAIAAALLAGGSVREVERISGVPRNTVERWGRRGGWPSAEQKAQWAEEKRRRDELAAKFEAARRQLDEQGEQ